MAHLAPIQLNDGTIIYIEASADSVLTETASPGTSPEVTRGDAGGAAKGWTSPHQIAPRVEATQRMDVMEGTIRAYTQHTLSAFQKVANANIDKVTLEFGVKISGEAGIPYITKGSAESNLKITVECSFPE